MLIKNKFLNVNKSFILTIYNDLVGIYVIITNKHLKS